jgi:hypothetical protein
VLGAYEPHLAAKALIELANAHGGRDNVTVQIVVFPAEAGVGDSESTWPRAAEADAAPRLAPDRSAHLRRRTLVLSAASAVVAALLLAAIGWLVFTGLRSAAPAPPGGGPGAVLTP